jgi:hypothetical protein
MMFSLRIINEILTKNFKGIRDVPLVSLERYQILRFSTNYFINFGRKMREILKIEIFVTKSSAKIQNIKKNWILKSLDVK